MRNKSEGARNRARNYRSNPSITEKIIWAALRKDQLGFRFRRQFPIEVYTLDFYCPEAKLCVEMDSELHDVERDKVRDEIMKAHGILTLRINNLDYLGLKQKPSRDWLLLIKRTCEERTGQSSLD